MTVRPALWKKLAGVEGFVEGLSIFGTTDEDLAYFVDGTQVANERRGELELRLTRAVIREHRDKLKRDPRIELRRNSDWVTIRTHAPADDPFVLELARLAAAAHIPADGRALRPPPSGSDLARRRRFH